MMREDFFVMIFFTCLWIQFSYETITFEGPSQLTSIEENAYQFMFIGEKPSTNVSGRLVAADPIHACSWEDIKNKEAFEGNIVLVRRDHCSPATKFRTAQKGSAHAIVILVSTNEYVHLSASYFLHTEGITIPGYEFQPPTKAIYDQILTVTSDNNTYVQVLIKGDLLTNRQDFWISFSVIQGTFALVNIFVAYRKLKQLFSGPADIDRTLPQITLAIEMLTNLLRVILCLEPDYGLGRGLIEFGTLGFLQSGTLPWSLVPTLIIAFYWDNAIQNWEKYMKKSWNVLPMRRCKLPLIFVISLIVMGDLISGVIRAMYYGNMTLANIIILTSAAVVFVIAFLFTINGTRALYFMWTKCQEANPTHRLAMRNMTNFVAANSFGIYVVVGALLFMTAGEIRYSWEIGYFGVATALNFVSLMQILVFDPRTIFQLADIEKVNSQLELNPPNNNPTNELE